MNKTEVIQLLIAIKQAYSGYDTSPGSVDNHLNYLADMPYDQALTNVKQHILTDKFPPKIADIRKGYTADQEHEQLKADTAAFFRQQDEWATRAAPPPAGMKEALRDRLFGKH